MNFEEVLLNHWQDNNNQAVATLLRDYKVYHGVIVVLFLLVAIGSIVTAVKLFKAYRGRTQSGFTSKSLMTGFILAVSIALVSLLLTVANASNTFIQPEVGFQTMTESFENSNPNSKYQAERAAFADWIESENQEVPNNVKSDVQAWRFFHIKKAMISFLLFALFSLGMVKLWQYLAKLAQSNKKIPRINKLGLVGLGLSSSLLLLMVIANIQGAISPLFSYLIKLV